MGGSQLFLLSSPPVLFRSFFLRSWILLYTWTLLLFVVAVPRSSSGEGLFSFFSSP